MQSQLDKLLNERRSIRAYTDARVDQDVVAQICRAARRAPSGANLQPGKFHALSGAPLGALKRTLQQTLESGAATETEYSYFPDTMSDVLKARQRAAGYALYEALGIARRDVDGRRAQFAHNYAFFDAPVGVIVTIDRSMGKGCFMDLGMALMAFLLAVEDRGLGATGIGAIANYGSVVHHHLGLPVDELVVCGIALGVPDRTAPVNQCRTARADVSDYATFQGFDT